MNLGYDFDWLEHVPDTDAEQLAAGCWLRLLKKSADSG